MRTKYKVEFFLFQALKNFVLALPLEWTQRIGEFLGAFAYHVMARRRRITMENLRNAFPEKNEHELTAIAKGAFQNYGIEFLEFLWFPNLTPDILRNLISFRTTEYDKFIAERTKGCIFLCGHFGNWELTALSTAWKLQKPFLIIVQTQNNKLVDEVINKHRCTLGSSVVPMGKAAREVLRALQQNNFVAIAPDQSGSKESVHVNFFGRKVATHEGTAVFALRTGAPIIYMFSVRKPDYTYDIIFEKISLDNLPEGYEAQIEEVTKRHTEMLERYIRLYPHQWLWMHKRWKHVEETSSKDDET